MKGLKWVSQLSRRKKRILLLASAGLLLLCIGIGLAVSLGSPSTPAKRRETAPTEYSVFPEEIRGVPVYTQLVEEGAPGRPEIKRSIWYVVIHETDNWNAGADAAAHADFLSFNSPSTTAWHYTVDDHEIYHHIPDNEVAYHAGDGAAGDGNLHGIGVEICVNEDGNFEAAFDNAAKLTAYLVKEYGLSLNDVKMHYDFSGKNCPSGIRRDGRWKEFKARVAQYLQ